MSHNNCDTSNQKMTEVYSTYDTTNKTWNIIDTNKKCLFYGTIDQLED